MKNFWYKIKDYVYIVIIVVLIRTFIVTPAKVNGASMEPKLYDKNLVIQNKIVYTFSSPKRFDVVVIRNKEDKDRIIKRVIGLPNEKIEYKDNILYINGKEIKTVYGIGITNDFEYTTKEDEYFVLGDNREVSKDSRMLGGFNKKDILGRVKLRFYPIDKFGNI